jgi:hypothetical protein
MTFIIIIIITLTIIINPFKFSGDAAFYSCTSLTQILLTSGITQIGPEGGIFQQTGVTSLTVPSTVTFMGEGLLLLL